MNVVKLAKAFSARGHRLHLMTTAESTIASLGREAYAETTLFERRRKYFDLKAAKLIARRYQDLQIDVLMVCDNRDLDMVCWAKRRYHREMRIVYHQQMQIGIDKKDFLHTLRFKAIDRWIAPLPYLKTEIGLRTNYPTDRVEVVPLCVDTKVFRPDKYRKTEARRQLSLDSQVYLIGIIGRITEKKGQHFMVKALARARERGQEIELLVFGSATVNDTSSQAYDKEMRAYVSSQGLSERVHFRPHQEDVALFYNAVDLFLLGSHSETFGMVTVEAMLAGLPIIATRSGGTSDLLDDGALGELYTYEDESDFDARLDRLLADRTASLQKGSLAKKKAEEHYTLESEVSALSNILQDVAAS